MLNQIVLVGRLTKEIKEEDNKCKIQIAIPRSFKNTNGEYETDFVNCIAFGNIGSSAKEYCEKGDLIGIKGRVQTTNNKLEVIAERITFLNSKKSEVDE